MKGSAAWTIGRAMVVVLLSGLGGATLVRIAPGFGVDERALDPRLSPESRAAVEREHEAERDPMAFYVRFVGGMLRGEAGRSIVFGEPVGQLISERAPATIGFVLTGLAYGWMAALFSAVVAVVNRRTAAAVAAMTVSGTFLSIPAAVLATIGLLLRLSPSLVIAAVVFPRIFPHAYEQLRSARSAPHVTMARAAGLGASRLFVYYVLLPAMAPLIALAGVSITLAFGAAIPVEALADVPGIGQLAWRSAMERDLPVLVGVTLCLILAARFVTLLSAVPPRETRFAA